MVTGPGASGAGTPDELQALVVDKIGAPASTPLSSAEGPAVEDGAKFCSNAGHTHGAYVQKEQDPVADEWGKTSGDFDPLLRGELLD